MAKTPREQIGVDLPEPEPLELQAVEPEPAPEPADERPQWLPEKYKSPEDLAAAHASAERKIREQGEQLSQMQRQFEEFTAQQQYAQQQPDPDAYREQLETAWEADPLATMQWLAQQTAAATAQQMNARQAQQLAPQFEAQNEILAANADMLMDRRYDDWSAGEQGERMKDRVAQAISEDPLLLPDAALSSMHELQNRLDIVYTLVKSRDLLAEQQQLRDQGVQQADISRARKLSAATLPGASGRAEQPSPADQQLAEMKASLSGSYTHLRERGGA